MSNTYTGTVITSPSFTSQPAQAFPDDIQGTLVELDSLPSGISVDNIFYYDSPNTGKYLKRVIDGTYRAIWAGIFADSSNHSTELQNVLDHDDIKEVIFDDPAGGDYVINTSTIEADGKVLRFANGCRLVGSGTINNAIIAADLEAHIFDTNINLTNCRPSMGKWSVKWFGAQLNETDDTDEFQRTSDIACESYDPVVYIPSGIAKVKNWVLGKYESPTSGEYFFNTITVEGAVTAYVGKITEIRVEDPDAFGIGIQAGRQVIIKNIAFTGMTPVPGTVADMISWTDTQWRTGGIRSNPYSPHAAIVIDPFHSTVPSGDRYPNLSSRYTNTGQRATSMVTIEGCSIYRFEVGVMVSPNHYTQNCDNIVFQNGSAQCCKAFWASGQTQSRANQIKDSYFLGNIQFLVNTVQYGTGLGSAPRVSGCNIAGSSKYLYYIQGGFEGIDFHKCYAESVWALGLSGVQPVTFNQCNINFMVIASGNPDGGPMVLAEGNQVMFTDSSVQYFANGQRYPMMFAVNELTFRGGFIRGGVPLFFPYRENITTFDDVHLNSFGGFYHQYKRGTISAIVDYLFTRPMGADNTFIIEGRDLIHKSKGRNIDLIFTESLTPTSINSGGDQRLIFTSSDASMYQVGDLLVSGSFVADPYNFFSSSASLAALGFIESISGNVVTCMAYMQGLPIQAYSIYIATVPQFQERTLGNTVNGSAVVNLIKDSSNRTFIEGSFIYGPGIAPATRVISVSSSSLTLSRNATATASRVELRGTPTKMTKYRNTDAPGSDINGSVFFKGDELINDYSSQYTKHIGRWVCVLQGKMNDGTYPPEFRPYYIGPDSFTLPDDGTRDIPAKTMIKTIAIKASSNLDVFKVGTSSGAQDVVASQTVTGSTWVSFPVDTYFESAGTLYFGIDFPTSVTGTVEILIYES